MIEDHVSLASAEFLNVLFVTVDWPLAARVGGELASIRVIGIEDLIVEHASDWLARRMPTSEVATKSRVLVTPAQSGVGGRFRGEYLQRRLAWETNGEVAFDASPSKDDLAERSAPRMITLTRMQTLINAWRLRHGFAFDAPGSRPVRGSRRNRTLENRYQNDEARRAGASSFVSANVVPFDVYYWLRVPSAPIRPQGPELAVFGLSHLSRSTVPSFWGRKWQNVSAGWRFQQN